MKHYSTLYIIGNGFDINLGIKSRYEDFRLYYAKQKFEIIQKLGIPPIEVSGQKYAEFMDDAEVEKTPITTWQITSFDLLYNVYLGSMDPYGLEENDFFWYEFETYLEKLDVTTIGQHYLSEDGDMTFARNEEGLADLAQNLKDSFAILTEAVQSWACQIQLPPIRKTIDAANAYFFTFNYTRTLEEVFCVDEECIHHIHGCTTDPGSIKIGCDRPPKYDLLDRITGTDLVFEEYFKKLRKQPKERIVAFRQSLRDRGESLAEVDRIIVLGHSFNEVDWPYFSALKKLCRPRAKWIVSVYSAEDKQRFVKMAMAIGITLSRVEFHQTIGEIVP